MSSNKLITPSSTSVSFMELQFPPIPLLLASLLFIFILVKNMKRFKPKNSTPKLPPGPRKLFLIGNIHQLLGSALAHHTLKKLATKFGPLMHLQLGEMSTIVVSSPEIAKEVMKTHDIVFVQRPYSFASRILSYDSQNIAFSPYGDYWRQMQKKFGRGSIESSKINETSPINLSKKIFVLMYGVTARVAFGRETEGQEEFVSIVEEVADLIDGFTIVDMYPSVKLFQVISGIRGTLKKMHKRIDRILENIVNDHRERKRITESGKGEEEDLVDVLLRIQKHGDLEFPLTDNNIKAVILIARSETPSTIVDWAMSEMLKNPQVMKRAQAEARSVFDKKVNVGETCLHELKYLSSKAVNNVHLMDTTYLPRPKSLSMLGAIGQDPKYWNEAEKFDPERFLDSEIDFKGRDFEFIPFGAGRRICPAISFAIPNVELPLAQLLYNFDWKLPDGKNYEELDMEEDLGLIV
ncbi:unnamed protein product [Camellia sinensis]